MSGHADIAAAVAVERKWAEVARGARRALAELGYPALPECLPDESVPCEATTAEHVAAYLATIKAVCDHQLSHLGQPYIDMHGAIYLDKRAELYADPDCQGVH